MTLAPGVRLGPYEILSALGAGGMGEVYRARDGRLGREVAIKVLPQAVAGDSDRLRRFEQEARAAGQLDHPNLLTVFDVGTHEGAPYIVSELLRGETLRERLAAGPLPRAKAVEVAVQVARGLAAAHDKGVVHRDLKPENLFLTRDGRAKILDFGLARFAPDAALDPPQSEAATESALTTPGTVVGTIGYMSPEQVRGEPVDARSDLFSFGAVLYEMLTGRRAFARGSAVETMGAILKEEPPDEPPATNRGDGFARVLRRCLEKRRDDRFRSADDLAFALELSGAAVPVAAKGPTPAGVAGRAAGRGRGLPWLIAGALAVMALSLGLRLWSGGRASVARGEIATATLTPITVDAGDETDPSFAPDGETLAYASDRSGNYEIYLQKVSGGPAINLTKDDGDDVQPSFSPDGQSIAFVSTRQSRHPLAYRAPRLPLIGGDVWVMSAFGGPPHRIAEDGNFPAWSPDGRSVYYVTGPWNRSEIRRVPAAGGDSSPLDVRVPSGDWAPVLLGPSLSPDGRWLAFWARGGVYVVASAGGEARRLAAGSYPVFGPDGASILYANADPGKAYAVWRAPFDAARGTTAGPGVPLTFGTSENAGVIAPSRDGQRLALVSVERAVNLEAMPFDADGNGARGVPVALTGGGHRVGFFGPSPDGRSVVFQDERGTESHLWRVDGPGAEPTQLTLDPAFADSFPRWSPDGRAIAFSRQPRAVPDRDGAPAASSASLWVMAADGASPRRVTAEPVSRSVWLADSATLVASRTAGGRYSRVDLASGRVTTLLEDARMLPIFDVSQDGLWLACQSTAHDSVDVLAARLDGSQKPRFVVAAPTEDYHPFFSPAGRWLYYQPEHKNIFRVPGPAQGWRQAPPEQVTHFPERGVYLEEPQISRDGRMFLYARAQITGDIWLLRLR